MSTAPLPVSRPAPAWATAILAVVVAALLGGLVLATIRLAERDRAGLSDAYAEERLGQLLKAASVVEESLDDVVADLRFASGLVATAPGAEERKWALRALLGSTEAYVAAVIVAPDGREVVLDGSAAGGLSPALEQAVAATAQGALAGDPERVEVSTPLPMEAGDDAWTRVFAARLDDRSVIALVVDMRPFLDPLRVVVDDQTRLLVLGPHGRPTPMSSASAMAVIDAPDAPLAAVVQEMQGGRAGRLRIASHVADAFAFPQADVVAVWTPIRMEGARHWSVATFSSTQALGAHERALIARFAFASGGIGLVVLLFLAYVAVTSRRAAVLREQLAHRDALAHLEEKAQKILDNIPSPVLALDAAGRISSRNAALGRVAPDAGPGSALASALPGADAETLERVRALVDRAVARGQTEAVVSERLRLFAGEGTYSVRAVPLAPPSDAARAIVVIDDLSELAALQGQLVRAEKLATVGILGAGIAHEIGTPLAVIRGRAEYVLGRLGQEHPQGDGIRVIIDQIDRVVRTIRALLDFSRQRPVAVAPVSVGAAARAAAELLRYECERRGVEVDVSEVRELMVAADADQLQQVFVNLLMNALDASEPGGRVRIRAHADGVAVLEVSDDGHGIPEPALHRVLDPFFTTKKRGQGTGLGLSIVDQIAREHGATLQIRSRPGEGTQIELRWPLAAPRREVANG